MQKYSHSYKLPQQADNILQEAQVAIRWDNFSRASQLIEDARRTLQQYLSQDNMVPDGDVEEGWVRAREAEEEMDGLRKQARHYLETMQAMGKTSMEVVRISEERQRGSGSQGAKVVRHGQIDRQYRQQLEGAGDPSCPLYGKVVRITGTFDQIGMSRDEVAAACQQLGAKSASEGICKSMDVVIIGNNPGPTKQQKIEQWRGEGRDIMTISQFDLKEIINKYQNILKPKQQ